MYFPIAGIEINPLVPIVVSFVISFFTSMGGISGAFLLLPFQVSVLGYSSPSVSATNQFFNIIAIPSGVYRYCKEGRMVWPLVWIIVAGTLPGVLLGALIRIKYFPDPRNFKFFVGLVLLYMGIKMIKDLLSSKKNKANNAEKDFQNLVREFSSKKSGNNSMQSQAVTVIKSISFSELHFEFYDHSFRVNVPVLMALSLVVGVIGGIYGIGGGAIMAPFMITYLGLPVYSVGGAALMGTFVTSIAGVLFYQLLQLLSPELNSAPDYLLGFLFGTGGFVGMYCGSRFQKYVPARKIKIILVFCVLFPALKYIIQYF